MDLGYLGVPKRIVYVAKNYSTGLSGVYCKIQKPNGSIVGIFNMIEYTDIDFKGMYFFDYITSLADPAGDYVAIIVSTSENHRVSKKFNMFRDPATAILNVGRLSVNLEGEIEAEELLDMEVPQDSIELELVDESSIEMNVEFTDIEGDLISTVTIDGEL